MRRSDGLRLAISTALMAQAGGRMTSAELQARAALDREYARTAPFPELWEQSAQTWLALAELTGEREQRDARQRWWKPWTW